MKPTYNGTITVKGAVKVYCTVCGRAMPMDFPEEVSIQYVIQEMMMGGWEAGMRGILCTECREVVH